MPILVLINKKPVDVLLLLFRDFRYAYILMIIKHLLHDSVFSNVIHDAISSSFC